jgi:hypothetical protein
LTPSPPYVPRPWLWPNLLSLDAPIVAVLWQILFARCFHADVDLMSAVLLVLAVWLIYTADRLLDARSHTSRLPRHVFYRHNWPAVAPVWIAVLALAGWLAWTRLPPALFERGTALLTVVVAYFFAVHRLRLQWPKELAVAVLFALGASLAAWGHVRSMVDAATIVLFSCLCWINCAAIEKWEGDKWEDDKWDRQFPAWPVGAAALCVAAVAMVLLAAHRPVLSGAETASALVFVAIDRGRARLSRDALRVLADVALLSPLLFLPVAGMLV